MKTYAPLLIKVRITYTLSNIEGHRGLIAGELSYIWKVPINTSEAFLAQMIAEQEHELNDYALPPNVRAILKRTEILGSYIDETV